MIEVHGEQVRLTLPTTPHLLRVARLTAAGLAGRLGFTFDEIEDVKIAVDELCFAVVGSRGRAGSLSLLYTLEVDALVIEGSATYEGHAPELAPTELSTQILAAVVDEHELGTEGDGLRFRLVKRRAARAVVLDRADKKALMLVFTEYAATRDSALRDRLIEAHIGLAEYLARRFANRGEPLDDLVQVASLGLVKAVERFDPGRGLEFTTFATPTIVGELKRHFRDKGWAVRVPRRVQELHLRVTRVIDDLSNELGRSPNLDEIAKRAGVTEDEVIEAIDAGSAYRSTSIDAGRSDDDESPGLLGQLGDLDPELARSELRTALGPLIAALPEREQVMLYLRFYEGLTQSEIAKRLGISQMHVSRLLARSLAQLRELGDSPD